MSYLRRLRDRLLPMSRRRAGNEFKQIKNLLHVLIKRDMVDYIWQNGEVKFYLPNYPEDFIQREIVDGQCFYEQDLLDLLCDYIKPGSTIADIGANVGNHTLYWLTRGVAQFVYCFEPNPEPYRILQKNIEINGLADKVQLFNLALSDDETNLEIVLFNSENIGATVFAKSGGGRFPARRLDDLQLERGLDFVKIDVEGMEANVLRGAQKMLSIHKPLIFVEIFPQKFKANNALLKSLHYRRIWNRKENHLYQHTG